MVDSEKIKIVRLALKKNQTEFGKMFQKGQNVYSLYETGERKLPWWVVRLLILEHGLNPEWWDKQKEPIFIPKDITNIPSKQTSVEASVWKIKFEHEEAKCNWQQTEIELLKDNISTLKENILLLKGENKTLKEKVRT